MKALLPFILILALFLAGVVGSIIMTVQDSHYTLAEWRKESGYTGPVCLEIYTGADGKPACGNGAPYDKASVNAGEGYGLWIGCHKYNDPYACDALED